MRCWVDGIPALGGAWLAALVLLAAPPRAAAASTDLAGWRASFEQSLRTVVAEHREKVQAARAAYAASLRALAGAKQQAGGLDAVLQVRNETERFSRENSVPRETPIGLNGDLAAMQDTYRRSIRNAAAEFESAAGAPAPAERPSLPAAAQTAACPVCSGSGKGRAECAACKASGACGTCGGTGKRTGLGKNMATTASVGTVNLLMGGVPDQPGHAVLSREVHVGSVSVAAEISRLAAAEPGPLILDFGVQVDAAGIPVIQAAVKP